MNLEMAVGISMGTVVSEGSSVMVFVQLFRWIVCAFFTSDVKQCTEEVTLIDDCGP